MDVRILGPLEIWAGDERLPLPGRRQRALLGMLVVHANEVVSRDRLIEELWPHEAVDAATNTLQVTISRLRKALGAKGGDVQLETRSPGYVLKLTDRELDAATFERLLADGQRALAAGDSERAAGDLGRALAMWRGEALADFTYDPFAQNEIARLEELRLLAVEARIEAELRLGADVALIPELESLVGEHPLRERFRAQLMLSLYRAGRQADALEVFDRMRRLLLDELGLAPGPELSRLQQAILRQEVALELVPQPAVTLPSGVPGSQPRVRKSVTALSALITEVGAEAVELEALERIRAQGLEVAVGVLSHHGGTVQGPVGDNIVAGFGTPIAHEDDVLRSLRAAVDLRRAIAELNKAPRGGRGAKLAVRIGMETGEMVAGNTLPLSGGPVTTATRIALEIADGEIGIGETLRRAAAHALRVERESGSTWRLRELLPDATAIPRRLGSPLVGRHSELTALETALARVAGKRVPEMVTVLGEAGVGKTRLVREFQFRMGDEDHVLTGRCALYGERTTFEPLREVIRQAAGGDTQDHIRRLLAGDQDAVAVAVAVSAALGTGLPQADLADPSWAFRRVLETLARRRTLILVLDDVQWADPTLLDVLEHLAEELQDAPVLLLCVARPDLLVARPTWPGLRVVLAPLADEETEALIDSLDGAADLGAAIRRRIAERAEGNPLFAEQLLAFIDQDTTAHEEVSLPLTIQALLMARLDRLGPGERAAAEAGAVIGREFEEEAVAHLLPEEATRSAGRHLDALVQKRLATPVAGQDAFRFLHVLIQEAAYRSIAKERRAEHHERIADWLEQRAGGNVDQHAETLGFHLERAHRYREELGLVHQEAGDLAERAAGYLAAAGRAAFSRSDAGVAKALLLRAADLLAADDVRRLELSVRAAEACVECGDFAEAEELVRRPLEEEQRYPGLAAHAALTRLRVRIENADVTEGQIARDLAGPIAVFTESGDGAGLAYALTFLARDHWLHGRAEAGVDALEEAILQAERAGELRRGMFAGYWLSIGLVWGDTPIGEAVARCEALVERRPGVRLLEAGLLCARSARGAMVGRFAEARAECRRAIAIFEELGQKHEAAAMEGLIGGAMVERLAGAPGAAEGKLRDSLEALKRLGDVISLSKVAGFLADAVYAQGRSDEAEALTIMSQETAFADIDPQIRWRHVRAKVLARRGAHEGAERLAREAVALASQTELLNYRGDALMDLAEVLRLGGRAAEAAPHLEAAADLYERKGNTVQAAWARRALENVASAPASR